MHDGFLFFLDSIGYFYIGFSPFSSLLSELSIEIIGVIA